jgi:hypothetical protein
VGKWKSSYKMASKSSKISVKVNSRLRGRSEILQQLNILEKVDHTVDYGFKVDRTVNFQDFRPTTVNFSKKSPATVDL